MFYQILRTDYKHIYLNMNMHENIHMSIIIVYIFDGLHKFKSSTNNVKLVDFLATYVNLHVVYYIVGCCAPFALE